MTTLAIVSANLLASPTALLLLQYWRRPRLGAMLAVILMVLGIIFLVKKIATR